MPTADERGRRRRLRPDFSAPTTGLVHLSALVGASLEAPDGTRLGRVDDLIVRLEGEEYPPLTGCLVRVGGRRTFVGAEQIATVAPGRVTLASSRLDLRPFERRPDEVLLDHDVQDRQLVNVDGARVVRANDVQLADVEGRLRVVGVDTGPRGFLRRLLPRRARPLVGPGPVLDWADVEPFVGHVPTLRLRTPHPKLARLHPAQIADIVEAVSHGEGRELLGSLAADDELEADVFEELDAEHQQEFLAERSDDDVADTLAHMESDDAADVLAELPEARRPAILALLPPTQRRRLETLLGYSAQSAGGLMGLDFVVVASSTTAAEAIARIAASAGPEEALTTAFAIDDDGYLLGGVSLVALLRAPAGAAVGSLQDSLSTIRVTGETDIAEVARTMADYDLVVVPVVDGASEVLAGVVTVDDVLEATLPRRYRRLAKMLGDDDQ